MFKWLTHFSFNTAKEKMTCTFFPLWVFRTCSHNRYNSIDVCKTSAARFVFLQVTKQKNARTLWENTGKGTYSWMKKEGDSCWRILNIIKTRTRFLNQVSLFVSQPTAVQRKTKAVKVSEPWQKKENMTVTTLVSAAKSTVLFKLLITSLNWYLS